jgi:hypothetical protein
MGKIKYFTILLISLLILSGCSANAHITMSHDGKVTEKINISDNNKSIVYGDKSIENSIELFLEKYDTALNLGNYKSEIYTGKTNSGASIYRDYDDICKLVRGTIFSQYIYNNIECNENKYFYEIKSVGEVVKNTDRYDSWLAPENINLKITLPITAEEQNADKIDGNTYTWNYNSNTNRDKSLYLKISKASLENYNNGYLEKQQQKNNVKKIISIVLIILIIIIIAFTGIILYKKYKKNNFDYE